MHRYHGEKEKKKRTSDNQQTSSESATLLRDAGSESADLWRMGRRTRSDFILVSFKYAESNTELTLHKLVEEVIHVLVLYLKERYVQLYRGTHVAQTEFHPFWSLITPLAKPVKNYEDNQIAMYTDNYTKDKQIHVASPPPPKKNNTKN